jgi:hypothetical protein
MSQFKGQRAEVSVFPVTFEGNWIASAIYGMLISAKWDPGFVRHLSEPPKVRLGTGGANPAPLLVQGIYIQTTSDQASKTAGRALYDALSQTVASGIWSPADLADGPPRVWVLVGDRPTPLSTWVK